jgi:tetratricopeptide (TPR) repeat protein
VYGGSKVSNNYFDLGTYGRSITTHSPEAQLWFDRGLMWCYSYNHEESIRCFQKALEYDPDCAMAYWGIAYASGPNYNYPWDAFAEQERVRTVARCHKATQTALAKSSQSTPIEQALIQTLPYRYQSPDVVSEEGFVAWNDDYAAAMNAVYTTFSDDLDVATLCAEAIINRNPWLLWDLKTGEPAEGADTLTAVAILERGMKQVEEQGLPPHPGLLHMYIHVMEMSPYPERALRASDILRDLVPEAGHLLHMPSHIDILCGDYYNAVIANSRAIVADNKYLQREGALNFYTAYRVHDFHFKLYAAMFLGQYQTSLDTAVALAAAIPEALLRIEEPAMANMLESVISMKQHVYIRFGKWEEINAEPLPEDQALYCYTTADLH